VTDSPTTVEWIVGAEDVGERADVVLGRRVPGLSRRVARSLARTGALRIDAAPAIASTRVVIGQRLELAVAPTSGDAAELRVLAVTADFVYVDKPAGVHTHRLRPGGPDALADAVAARFPECAGASPDPREGGAIHRLDRMTTGVTAFARSPGAWRRGRAAMADPRARKIYVAVVCSAHPMRWPPHAAVTAEPSSETWWEFEGLPVPQSPSLVRLELPLGRGADRQTVAVRPGGRPTHCNVVPLAATPDPVAADGAGRGLVAVALGRGHRHQIRVHLAWLGMPIEGDARYGGSPAPGVESSLALHCIALDLSACTAADELGSCAGEQRVCAGLPAALEARVRELQLRPWARDAPPW
jgi:23S rRNA pseudouridine1911/1915/1917 synthase